MYNEIQENDYKLFTQQEFLFCIHDYLSIIYKNCVNDVLYKHANYILSNSCINNCNAISWHVHYHFVMIYRMKIKTNKRCTIFNFTSRTMIFNKQHIFDMLHTSVSQGEPFSTPSVRVVSKSLTTTSWNPN
jgi:hypothetical protein